MSTKIISFDLLMKKNKGITKDWKGYGKSQVLFGIVVL